MAHFWLVNDQSLGWFGVSPFSEIPWISAKMIMYIYIYMLYMLYIYMYIYAIYIWWWYIIHIMCVGNPYCKFQGKIRGQGAGRRSHHPIQTCPHRSLTKRGPDKWGFRENGGSQKRCLKRENPTYMDDLGVPLFSNHVKDCQKMNTLTCRVGCETATSATATESRWNFEISWNLINHHKSA